ncbi:MAG: hypothetical protein WC389_22785 [Lutibacter sp.]
MVHKQPQKKIIKRILIRPSKMVIVNNSKELSELKLNLAKIIGISITDIEFTYVSLSDK